MLGSVKWILCFLGILCSLELTAQVVEGVVIDGENGKPIPDVFLFFANSSYGAITDEKGYFKLERIGSANDKIVCSHLNYEVLELPFDKVKDTIRLISKHLVLEEVVVAQKVKKRIRKKRLKRFTAEIIGDVKDKKLIRLQNPEVLLFEKTKNNKLIAQTTEPLIIENRLLGYEISFFLKEFELSDDGQYLLYEGNAFFKDLTGTGREMARYKRARRKVYEASSRHFFSNLLQKDISASKYRLGYASVDTHGNLGEMKEITPDSLSIIPQKDNRFVINLEGTLVVVHQDIYLPSNSPDTRLSPTYATGIKNMKKKNKNFLKATSYFRSKHNEILLNQSGRIVNPLEVEEFGYWSRSRLGTLLPFDYQP